MSYRDTYTHYNDKFSDIEGRTILRIEHDNDGLEHDNDGLVFHMDNGDAYHMWYEPDCCASCNLVDTGGDLADIVNARVSKAEESVSDATSVTEEDGWRHEESATWTFYNLSTDKGDLSIRWFGSSNGHYSETASFRRWVMEQD